MVYAREPIKSVSPSTTVSFFIFCLPAILNDRCSSSCKQSSPPSRRFDSPFHLVCDCEFQFHIYVVVYFIFIIFLLLFVHPNSWTDTKYLYLSLRICLSPSLLGHYLKSTPTCLTVDTQVSQSTTTNNNNNQ
jgi:hypothetical protein